MRGASPSRREFVSSSLGAAHAASHLSQNVAGLPEHLRWYGQSSCLNKGSSRVCCWSHKHRITKFALNFVFLFCLKNGEGLCWKELLRIKSPHKLLYALEIIEALGKPNRRIHRESTVRQKGLMASFCPQDPLPSVESVDVNIGTRVDLKQIN